MGHLNDHDPADTRAITRSRLGLNRETQRFRTGHYPHPSRGGTRGFPLWLRTVATNDLLENGIYLLLIISNAVLQRFAGGRRE